MTFGDQVSADTARRRRLPLARFFAPRSNSRRQNNAGLRNAEIRLASEAAALSARRRELARKRADYEQLISKTVRMIAEAERMEADARARVAAHELAAENRARRFDPSEHTPATP